MKKKYNIFFVLIFSFFLASGLLYSDHKNRKKEKNVFSLKITISTLIKKIENTFEDFEFFALSDLPSKRLGKRD
jgi:hypothetical protein